MKINSNVISIPPYITTSWENVNVINVEIDKDKKKILIISLESGDQIKIPELSDEDIHNVTSSFESFIEKTSNEQNFVDHNSMISGLTEVFQQFINDGKTSQATMSQSPGIGVVKVPLGHSALHSNMPIFDPESLRNIIKTIKAIGEGRNLFEKGEYQECCNCIYCQACKFLQEEKTENELKEENLEFASSWNVEEVNSNEYLVSNKENNSTFNVKLEPSVACSCGSNKCEHIRIVLMN